MMNPSPEDLDPADRRRLLAAEGYLELGLPAEARDELNDLSAEATETTRCIKLVLRSAEGIGCWEVVALSAARLMERESGNPLWKQSWDVAVARTGVARALRATLAAATQTIPGDASVLFNAALCCARLGHPREAGRYLVRAALLDPSWVSVAWGWPEMVPVLKGYLPDAET